MTQRNTTKVKICNRIHITVNYRSLTVKRRCSFISATNLATPPPSQNPDEKTSDYHFESTCSMLWQYRLLKTTTTNLHKDGSILQSFPSLTISNQSRLGLTWCYQHIICMGLMGALHTIPHLYLQSTKETFHLEN